MHPNNGVPAVPTVAEKEAALEAVLASETFARSEQLRAFLRFICEAEMAGHGSELTEYLIGVKALGRPEDYSPLEDSSVRTRAYELRQRLQKFYETEHPTTAWRIDVPKGSYTPRYVCGPLTHKSAGRAETAAAHAEGCAPARRRGWWAGFLAGVAAGGALAAGVLLWHSRTGVDATLRRAWRPVAATDPEVLICMSTPLHLQVSPFIAAVPEGRSKYPAPAELYPLFSRYRNLPKDARLEMEPVQKAVSMGSVQGLARVLATLHRLGANYRILPETSSPLAAMRKRSVLVFGSPWYSRVSATLLERTPWTTALDAATGQIGIVGRGPQAGKKYLPGRGPKGSYEQVYGLLTVLPAEPAEDDGRTVVVFSGLTSAGTDAAAAFFASPANLRHLEDQFRREGLPAWPRSYQVLVRCRASEDTQMLSYSFEAHQVIAR